MIQDAPNINHLWTRLLVEELRRNGVDTFYISPGSRSTPLTLAAAQTGGVQTYVHFDERGAAFAAMGHAMGSERPTALICTSGTAAANYLPAIVEASQSGIPLIVLTADRPPELTDAGANQAINQIGLYRNFTRWEHALPCPTTEMPAQPLLTAIDQACFRANGNDPGPVHINCPFREPLAPRATDEDWTDYLAPLERWLESDEPYTRYVEARPTLSESDAEKLCAILEESERGLLVIGRLSNQSDRDAAWQIADVLDWPRYVDITCGQPVVDQDSADRGVASQDLSRLNDLVLVSECFQERFIPDTVLHLGGPFVSKRLLQHLERVRPTNYIRVLARPNRDDPAHITTWHIASPIAVAAESVRCCANSRDDEGVALNGGRARSEWRKLHTDASFSTSTLLSSPSPLFRSNTLSEPQIAHTLMISDIRDQVLFLGNSMPVRDANTFRINPFPTPAAVANRGASGIDGNIATAAGLARGGGKRVIAVIGDVAALHDLNSFALLQDNSTPVTLVIINNDGGGIFHFLPIADESKLFEKYFGTPHGLKFEQAAVMFGLEFFNPKTMVDFVASLNRSRTSDRSSIIEVETDRYENSRIHQTIQEAVREAIDQDI